MSAYKPPYDITDFMLEKVSSISEKVGRLSVNGNLISKPHLRKNNAIKSVYSSLRVEANSLSLEAVSDIIDGHMVVGKKNEIDEVKNAYSAYEQIANINPYDMGDLCRLHGIMTAEIIKESGVFRSGNEGVFEDGNCIFVAPPPELVPKLMDQLFCWMKSNHTIVHPLIMAAIFHYEFVFIHPFADGNGRMARLWHTALLTKWRDIFEFIPLESQIERFQTEYYEAISKCHVAGNSNVFIEFILRCLDEIVDEVAEQCVGETSKDPVDRLLGVMKHQVGYSTHELLEMLQLKSRASFRKHYLLPALEQGKIAMEIPDKPSSRNQKYIRL